MKPRRSRPRPAVEPSLALGAERTFLSRFDEPELRAELEREGILSGLAARGYKTLVLARTAQGAEHRLRIRPRGRRTVLVDMRLEERTLVVEEPLLRRGGLEVISALANNWLSLQDPEARFLPERPRLPGQRWPGLGLARAFYSLLARWAHEWGKDAVVATPDYFHNAVFYSPTFRFLSPRDQGRFEALVRDLEGQPIATASAAVDEGRVEEDGRPFEWRPGLMVAPASPALARALDGPEHRRAAAEAAAAARFRYRLPEERPA